MLEESNALLSKKKITLFVIAGLAVSFATTLLYSEQVTDENRFLIQKLVQTDQTVVGEPFAYPDAPANIETHFIEMLPGAESGWHTHDVPLIVTILHGEITIYYCDKEWTSTEACPQDRLYAIERFSEGDSFVEAMNHLHNGKNEGIIPVKIHVATLNPGEHWEDKYDQ